MAAPTSPRDAQRGFGTVASRIRAEAPDQMPVRRPKRAVIRTDAIPTGYRRDTDVPFGGFTGGCRGSDRGISLTRRTAQRPSPQREMSQHEKPQHEKRATGMPWPKFSTGVESGSHRDRCEGFGNDGGRIRRLWPVLRPARRGSRRPGLRLCKRSGSCIHGHPRGGSACLPGRTGTGRRTWRRTRQR